MNTSYGNVLIPLLCAGCVALYSDFHVSVDVYQATDVCVGLQKEPGTNNFADSILAEIQTDSLGACAGMCASASGCIAVAVETDVRNNNVKGRCILAGLGYSTIVDTQFYLYHLIV